MTRVAADRLTDRVLNRTTLQRQLLLSRVPMDPLRAVEHLVGLQAQNPLDPYLALWSRIAGFDPVGFGQLLQDRAVVRIAAMRATVHLLTADDALLLRPLTQPVLTAEIRRHPEFAPQLSGLDLDPLLAWAEAELAERPLATGELRRAVAERFPGLPAAAAAYACRCLLPLVQVPPRGVWGRTRQVTLAPLAAWVGGDPIADPAPDDVVLRYLAAFGPASVADVTAWCRLTGMRAVVERLRPRLRSYRSPRGTELLDVAGATLAEPDVPAPVRLLPEYDNVVLSHADRSRFGSDAARLVALAGSFKGSVLVDGLVRGGWRFVRGPGAESTRLVLEHLPLTQPEVGQVEAEAEAVAELWAPNLPGGRPAQVRLVPAG
jgi:hypothetical protein